MSYWTGWKRLPKRERNQIRRQLDALVRHHAQCIAQILEEAPPEEALMLLEEALCPPLREHITPRNS